MEIMEIIVIVLLLVIVPIMLVKQSPIETVSIQVKDIKKTTVMPGNCPAMIVTDSNGTRYELVVGVGVDSTKVGAAMNILKVGGTYRVKTFRGPLGITNILEVLSEI